MAGGKRRQSVKSATRGYVRAIRLERDKVTSFDMYPFSIPAVRGLDELALHPKVTFFIGENGSGKSTLTEAIAMAAGFNAEGGSRHFNFATTNDDSTSSLHNCIRLVRGAQRPKDGYFLRAESYFNVATEIEKRDPSLLAAYGGKSLHAQSHGESFLALANNRFFGHGFYVLDEPEAALSPLRQLSMLRIVHDLVEQSSQLVVATHSPILMAYPNAVIYHLSTSGIAPIAYEETEHYRITLDFLLGRERFFKHMFSDADAPSRE